MTTIRMPVEYFMTGKFAGRRDIDRQLVMEWAQFAVHEADWDSAPVAVSWQNRFLTPFTLAETNLIDIRFHEGAFYRRALHNGRPVTPDSAYLHESRDEPKLFGKSNNQLWAGFLASGRPHSRPDYVKTLADNRDEVAGNIQKALDGYMLVEGEFWEMCAEPKIVVTDRVTTDKDDLAVCVDIRFADAIHVGNGNSFSFSLVEMDKAVAFAGDLVTESGRDFVPTTNAWIGGLHGELFQPSDVATDLLWFSDRAIRTLGRGLEKFDDDYIEAWTAMRSAWGQLRDTRADEQAELLLDRWDKLNEQSLRIDCRVDSDPESPEPTNGEHLVRQTRILRRLWENASVAVFDVSGPACG
jgi:hypothetical protein